MQRGPCATSTDQHGKLAESLCKEGLKAKFSQNPHLLDILLNKTGKKTLVECTNDRLWANGIPLYSDTCLNQQRWISQGLLGKILEEVRTELSQHSGHFRYQSITVPDNSPPTITIQPSTPTNDGGPEATTNYPSTSPQNDRGHAADNQDPTNIIPIASTSNSDNSDDAMVTS